MKIFILVVVFVVVLFVFEVFVQFVDVVFIFGKVQVYQYGEGQFSVYQVLILVDVLGVDQIESCNVLYSWELFGQMFGIQFIEIWQGVELGKVSFCVFNGEGYFNVIKMLIDGIFSNVNSGNQCFIDMLFLLDISYIEVVCGINDLCYGLYNIGGNVNFGMCQGGSYIDVWLVYGSYNICDVQLVVGCEVNGFVQNYFVGIQVSDGYCDYDILKKYLLGGKWFYGLLDDGLCVGLIVCVYYYEVDEFGFMIVDELCMYCCGSDLCNGNDGDDCDMCQIVVYFDLKLFDVFIFGMWLYYNCYEDDCCVIFSDLFIGNLLCQCCVWDEWQYGLFSMLIWQVSFMFIVEGGLNYEQQDNGYFCECYVYVEFIDFGQFLVWVQNNDCYSFDNWGVYVQVIYQLVEVWKIVLVYCVDCFSGCMYLMNGIIVWLQGYGSIGQFKLSIIYSLGQIIYVYVNWGCIFQVLIGFIVLVYFILGQVLMQLFINIGMELGLKFQLFVGSQVCFVVWQQDVENEVFNMLVIGIMVILGKICWCGVDVQLSLQLGDDWMVWVLYVYQEVKIICDDCDVSIFLQGWEVVVILCYISNLGVDYCVMDVLWLGLQVCVQGDYYLEECNVVGKFGGFVVFDFSVVYQFILCFSVDL